MNTPDKHHDPYLAHHFDSHAQQYSSAKVGMWVFLATEILMFGGLFCAYAVYRGTHPEVFLYAHTFLDTNLGATNTVILLTSSLTMAWGVRAAQLGQTKLLSLLLALTLLGAFGFMSIKYIEYKSKYEHKLWVGSENAFYYKNQQYANPEQLNEAVEYGESHSSPSTTSQPHNQQANETERNDLSSEQLQIQQNNLNAPPQHTDIDDPTPAPQGLSQEFSQIENSPTYTTTSHKAVTYDNLTPHQKTLVSQFFQIYFLMTGLHGIHVLVGIGLIFWLLIKALKKTFGPHYYTPVDIVGLYWHLVDLIWIFLFPLLYLIH